MNLLQCLLYGFVTGLTEFLPISSAAHKGLILKFFGIDALDPVLEIVVSIVGIVCVLIGCKGFWERYQREQHLYARNIRSRGKKIEYRSLLEMRLVKSAALPLVAILLFSSAFAKFQFNLPVLSLFLVVNGIIVYLPERMLQGSKDSRCMTRLDALIIGLCGSLSVFPGISRTAGILTAASARGAGRTQAVNWMLYLAVPALVAALVVNLFSLFIGTFVLSTGFLGYIFCGIGACCGGLLSIMIIRFLATRSGYSGFAYYCWGLALFSFIIYLTVV